MTSAVHHGLWLVLLASSAASAQANEEHVSICQLAKAGEQMNGHHVRVSVIYLTDLLETSILKDRRCPNVYIAPNWKTSKDPSLVAFDEALYARPDDLKLTTYSIDVSGTFVWRTSENPQGTLNLEKVWSFERVCGDWKEAK
jgi:hypothetical protein